MHVLKALRPATARVSIVTLGIKRPAKNVLWCCARITSTMFAVPAAPRTGSTGGLLTQLLLPSGGLEQPEEQVAGVKVAKPFAFAASPASLQISEYGWPATSSTAPDR